MREDFEEADQVTRSVMNHDGSMSLPEGTRWTGRNNQASIAAKWKRRRGAEVGIESLSREHEEMPGQVMLCRLRLPMVSKAHRVTKG